MKQKEVLIITITIFLTLIAWIAADLYHVATTEQAKVKQITSIAKLELKIDLGVIDALEAKQ